MTWQLTSQTLPSVRTDVLGIVQGFNGPRRDLVYLGESGHWYLADSLNDSPVEVSAWIALPDYPKQWQPQPAVGQNTGSSPMTCVPRTDLPSGGEADWPPQAANQPGWWCFTTSQLSTALDVWEQQMNNPGKGLAAKFIIKQFLWSQAAHKLQGGKS